MPADCSKSTVAEEVKDARAYIKLVNEVWETPPAARLMLGLHDVVSKSIALQYRPLGRRRIYCWEDFKKEINPVFLSGIPLVSSEQLDSSTMFMEVYQQDAMKVPGLGVNNCQRV